MAWHSMSTSRPARRVFPSSQSIGTTTILVGAVVISLALVHATDTPAQPQEPTCPAGSVAQPPDLNSPAWDAYISDSGPFYIRYERFEGISGWVCGIRWWGLNVYDSGSGFVDCDENPMSFEIKFYEDSEGQLGAEICSYTIAAAGTAVAQVPGGRTLYQYDASLDSCCAVMDGWVSIMGSGESASCWFMWNSSTVGDDSACVLNSSGLTCGTGLHYRDLSMCLVHSPVSTEATTWGAIKSMYR